MHSHSDIDIAVEERWPEIKVDLIDVGIVSKEMREWIDEEGQEL